MTLKEARNYAKNVEAATGNEHLVVKLPVWSQAYEMGMRYATCEKSERADYAALGAVFV